MGLLIPAGTIPPASAAAGGLNQYYGFADTTTTTVTAAAAANLSSVYTIPAGEAYTGAAYELQCGGSGTWGSTQQQLTLAMAMNGTSFGSGGSGKVAASALSASAAFYWTARYTLVCVDGTSSWIGRMEALVAEQSSPANPGTAGTNTIGVNNVLSHTATVSSSITVALQAFWASTTGAPTLTNLMTTWRKIS